MHRTLKKNGLNLKAKVIVEKVTSSSSSRITTQNVAAETEFLHGQGESVLSLSILVTMEEKKRGS